MLRLVSDESPEPSTSTPFLDRAALETESTAIALGKMINENCDDPAVAPFVEYLRMARFAMVSAHLALQAAVAKSKEQQ